MHPDWFRDLPMSHPSLLDIHNAFTDGNMDCCIPLVVHDAEILVPLSHILQQNLPRLFVQATKVVALLSKCEPGTASRSWGPDGALFCQGTAQALVLAACASEQQAHKFCLLMRREDEPALLSQLQQKVCSNESSLGNGPGSHCKCLWCCCHKAGTIHLDEICPHLYRQLPCLHSCFTRQHM